MSHTCLCCNKPLTAKVSIDRGLGPVCAAKKIAHITEHDGAPVDLPFDPVSKDIVVERRDDGLHFNIYQSIYHHSPTGFEISYSGSGPADFALNILEIFMRERGCRPSVSIQNWVPGERVSKLKITTEAWRLHQPFKEQWIASAPREGVVMPGDLIRAWISERL